MNNILKGDNDDNIQLDISWEKEDKLWKEEMNRIKCDRILHNIKKL